MTEATYAYIGIKPCCGKAVAVVVDDPNQYMRTAEIIVGWGRGKSPLEVKRVPVEYARTALARCTCKTARKRT